MKTNNAVVVFFAALVALSITAGYLWLAGIHIIQSRDWLDDIFATLFSLAIIAMVALAYAHKEQPK